MNREKSGSSSSIGPPMGADGKNGRTNGHERRCFWRLIQLVGVSAIIIPSGPLLWFVICVIRAGSLGEMFKNIAHWEEFSYKWPVACELSSLFAIFVSLKILLFEKQGRLHPATVGCDYRWALTRVLFPGFGIVGLVYGLESVFGLWFGNVFGFAFICYLVGLFLTRMFRAELQS